MNRAVVLALLSTHAPAWKKSFEILGSEWDLPTITEHLRPHLHALERAHEIGNREEEGETAIAFMAMWNARANTPDVYIALMQAACHRWMMDPPVRIRAGRLARERGYPIRDEFSNLHCPHGITYAGQFHDNPCKECCSECGGRGIVPAVGPDGEPAGEHCKLCNGKVDDYRTLTKTMFLKAETMFPKVPEGMGALYRDLLGIPPGTVPKLPPIPGAPETATVDQCKRAHAPGLRCGLCGVTDGE